MAEIEVPSYFLCPIVLDIMKDPVTISTGITYDRENIEKWIFSKKKNTCPVTKQVLLDEEYFTPNVILRRLIQSWCTLNSSHGIERLPTPKPPVSRTQLVKLLNEAKCPQTQIKCFQKLTSIASENQANKRCLITVGVPEFLASLIVRNTHQFSSHTKLSEDSCELIKACDEALTLLYNLELPESGLKPLYNSEFTESLARVMQCGSYQSRAYSIMLLKSILEVSVPSELKNLKLEFFVELAQTLNDQICQKASKATFKVLINVCPWGRNRIKAVEAGLVFVIIDLLLDSSEKREQEMMLIILDFLCQCPEGRSELMKHAAGLAIVSKKILRVSPTVSERAIRILHSISKHSPSPTILSEMLQIGVVAKLCLVIQVECGCKTKEKAREMLKLHARAWRNSSCIPTNLVSSYPS